MENFAPLVFKGLGWGIIHSLWVGALLYGVLMLAFQFLNWRAKTKSLFATMALFILLASFFFTFLYHLVNSPTAHPAMVAGMGVDFLPVFDYNRSVSLLAAVEYYFPIIIPFYTFGVLLQSVLVVNGFRKLHTIRRQGLLDVPGSWKTLLADKKRQLGLRMPIAFHFSTKVDVPVVVGHLKPVILFPISVFSGMRMDQVEAILIHELAHIKRSDYLINVVKAITETLLFFNPFAWLIGRMLEVEREAACDDVVVKLTSKPIHYAQTLLWLEELRQGPSPSLAMPAISKRKQLLHRIQRMTNMKNNYLNAKHKLAILTLLLGCAASLAWVKPFVGDSQTIETSILPPVNAIQMPFIPGDSAETPAPHMMANDTVDSAKKANIIATDQYGNILTFGKYEDMPDSLKAKVDVVKRQTDSIRAFYNSPEWKKKMEELRLSEEQIQAFSIQARRLADSMRTLYSSPEWKEKIEKMRLSEEELRDLTVQARKQADSMRTLYSSPEWKEKIEKMRLSEEELRDLTAQARKQADSMRAFFSSPEWKEKMKGMRLSEEELRDLTVQARRQADSIRAYFDSSEWKSKMEQWRRESKGRDTTLVWPTMTIRGQKHHVEQLLEQKRVMQQYQALHQEALAKLQQQYVGINQDKVQHHQLLIKKQQDQYKEGVRELQRFFAEQEKKY